MSDAKPQAGACPVVTDRVRRVGNPTDINIQVKEIDE